MADDEDDDQIYDVVVNHEEQYSIWWSGREIPAGWRKDGKTGTKAECLDHINTVWTDMRPLSLRKHMEELAKNPPPPAPPMPEDTEPPLVERLSRGQHTVQFWSRPERTTSALKERVERGYVHIRFPNTRGGTELGIRLDTAACDLSRADFDRGAGEIILVGNLTLDDVPVRCMARLDLGTLEGEGNLQPL
jgi:uncharacterized protein YbdZ (MbtH family)